MLKKFRNGEYKYLDVPIPDICADRLDYSLRHIKVLLNKDLFWILDHIRPKEVLEFINEKAALKYALSYLELSRKHYIGRDSALFEIISRVLRKAIDKEIITVEDFLTKGEEEIYEILLKDKELREILEKIKNVKIVEDKKSYNLIIKTKCRYVDQLVNGKRLSEINRMFKERVIAFLDECKNGIKVKIEPKII